MEVGLTADAVSQEDRADPGEVIVNVIYDGRC
jgi:hypothetical protein